nr:choice-of-anchor Q domain-containing protein [uncultured Arsenicibacter sp.]
MTTTGTASASLATSWSSSTTDLQGAINYVSGNGGGQVWVAQGTYKPTNYLTNPLPRLVSFRMRNGVAIYGGFPATGGPGMAQRNPASFSTVLSGDLSGNDTPDFGNRSDNTRQIVTCRDLNNTAVLDGFVLTGGNASEVSGMGGGAIYSVNSSPVLANCTFVSNQSDNNFGDLSGGGAIYSTGEGRLELTNCRFVNNRSNSNSEVESGGGAIFNDGGSLVLTNCTFTGNQTNNNAGDDSGGGAIYCNRGGLELTNCTFTGNQANSGKGSSGGGAIYEYLNMRVVLTGCTFTGNQANNTTGGSSGGGAIFNRSSSPVVTNCSFVGNQANNSTGNGSGGGAINRIGTSSDPPLFMNCSFQGNQATYNSATRSGGAVISNYFKAPILINCAWWDNEGDNTFYTFTTSPVIATYCLFDNSRGADISGPGNFTTATSPFAGPATTQLASGSPAIDKGDRPSYLNAGGAATDLAGNPRIMGLSCRIDIGAYEFPQAGIGINTSLVFTSQPAGSSAVCAGSSVSVPVSASGTGSFTYQWYRGDTPVQSQTAATLSIPSATTADAGSYMVIVTGICNSVTSTAFTLIVNPLPSVLVSSLPSTTVTCTNPSLTLTAASSATALRWSTNETTGSIPVSTSGTYSVTATTTAGCTAVSNNLVISQNTISPSVSISATGSVLTCAVPSLTLTATTSATALRWSTNATTSSIPVSTMGTYSVTATEANGCTASNTLSIGIDLSLPPFTISSATVCQGQTISLSADGCPGQVVWSTGSTGASVQLTAGASSSALTATCTVGSCRTTAGGSVDVGGLLPPPARILSLRADESGCPVQLIGQGVGTSFVMTGDRGYVFSIVYRQGGTHDAVGLNVKQAGVYSLTVTYTNECGTSAPVSRSVIVGRNCP